MLAISGKELEMTEKKSSHSPAGGNIKPGSGHQVKEIGSGGKADITRSAGNQPPPNRNGGGKK